MEGVHENRKNDYNLSYDTEHNGIVKNCKANDNESKKESHRTPDKLHQEEGEESQTAPEYPPTGPSAFRQPQKLICKMSSRTEV